MSGTAFALGAGTPGLDGGANGRRLARFRPPRAHVNALIVQSGRTVLDRARYLVRNNPYASNGCEYFAAQLVGAGITPAWNARSKILKKAITRAWLAWTDEADAEGLTDFYGLQRRASRELFIAGEVFLRERLRRLEDGLSVPLQYQMLPSEMLPLEDNRVLSNGNYVRSGIEFDAIGRRVAYHFYRHHPDDPVAARGSSTEQTRVPASQIIHVMDPVEAGQLRGLSRMAPAIVKLWMLDLYDDAELERKRVVALHVGVITSPAGTQDFDAEDQGDGTGVLDMIPGGLLNLPSGDDIKFNAPGDVGGSYEAFQYRNLLAAAAACGLPYVGLTGDMVKANYSNVRAALMDFRRRAEAAQHGVLIHQMCRPIGLGWLRQAVLAGSIPGLTPKRLAQIRPELVPIPWQPPGWEWIDPLKDRKAEVEDVTARLASRSSKIRARGLDPETVDAEIAEDMARERRLGITPAAAPPASPPPPPPEDPEEDPPANPEAPEE